MRVFNVCKGWVSFQGLHQSPPPPRTCDFFVPKSLSASYERNSCAGRLSNFQNFQMSLKNFPGTRKIFKTLSAFYEKLKKRCPWGGGGLWCTRLLRFANFASRFAVCIAKKCYLREGGFWKMEPCIGLYMINSSIQSSDFLFLHEKNLKPKFSKFCGKQTK